MFTDFTATMVPGNYVTQQEEFDNTPETELEYFGVCFLTFIIKCATIQSQFFDFLM